MTIKPIINQKSGSDEKTEQQQKNNIQRDKNIRLNVGADFSGLRRSPNKSCGRSKRDLKREKNPVSNKYQHGPTTSAGTSTSKKQLQLPSCTSVSAKITTKSQQSTQVLQQQQHQQIQQPIPSNSSSLNTSGSNSESSLLGDCINSDKGSCSSSSSSIAISNNVVNIANNNSPDQQPVDLLEILEEKVSGYNSGDEHLGQKETLLSNEEWKMRDENFAKELSKRGFIIKEMEEDGSCLFRAISYQLYGDQDMHEAIRQQTMDYIYQNREYFEHFITEDITKYVSRKRQNHLHGNHIEIQAMSEMYNRPVEVYVYDSTPINIYNSEQINNGYEPLRLSYHRYSHYNAIMDPYKSSVGVGLGLAGYHPEQFDPTKTAVAMSEQLEIEKIMVEDKLKTTDWEATSDVVVEQIARQSYLQFCKENMSRSSNKQTKSTSTITSTEASGSSSSAMSTDVSLLTGTTAPTMSPGSSSSNSLRDNDTESTCSIEYYMQHQHSSRRKKRHQSNEKRKMEEVSKTSDQLASSVTPQKRTKRQSPTPECHSKQNTPSTSSSPVASGGENPNSEPALSAFYRSLLESSYAVDGYGQMSEQEMLQKALAISAMDYIKRADRRVKSSPSTSKCNGTDDDEYDSP